MIEKIEMEKLETRKNAQGNAIKSRKAFKFG